MDNITGCDAKRGPFSRRDLLMPHDPFIHEIRVTWGDCDPAKIVYTGKLPAMALDAINAWWEAHLGHGWFQMELDDNLGTPFVQLQMNFERP